MKVKKAFAAVALGAAALFGASVPAHAQVSGDVIRIGVITDMSSVYADIGGQGSVEAIRMAIAFQKLELGFDPNDLLTLKAELPEARYASDDRLRAFYDQLEKRLAGQPGVLGFAVANARPVRLVRR